MKNIIEWARVNDAGFRRRLEARVRKVIRPLIRAKQLEARSTARLREFESLTAREKAAIVVGPAQTALRRLHFDTTLVTAENEGELFPITRQLWFNDWSFFQGAVVGRRKTGGAVEIVFLQVFTSVTTSLIASFRQRFFQFDGPIRLLTKGGPDWPQKGVKEHYILCSLKACSLSRLHSYLPSFRRHRDHAVCKDLRLSVPTRYLAHPTSYSKEITRSLYVYVLGGSRKLLDVESEIRSLLGIRR